MALSVNQDYNQINTASAYNHVFSHIGFTHILNYLHYVAECGMQIRIVSFQELTTRLIHKGRHASVLVKIMQQIHCLLG